MSYLGSWAIDDVLTIPLQTQGATGPVDADSAPSYRIYEDATATPVATGSFSLLDASNTDGFYVAQVTLSAANGYEASKQYTVRKAATVSGIVGVEVDTFQIRAKVSTT